MLDKELDRHNKEIHKNQIFWQKKPTLQKIYADFYEIIRNQIDHSMEGLIVELGSGIGNIKMVIPQAVTTDLFSNPWIDQVENAYQLSFKDNSVSHLILFDVLHHLEYPGSALVEFQRVLIPNGKIIIFDPAMSLTGLLVFGIFHHEPLAVFRNITWYAPDNIDPWSSRYYAAQANANKIFFSKKNKIKLKDWDVIFRHQYSAFAYILSGGYSKPQLFPDGFYKPLKRIEKVLDLCPFLFATRALIVLQKKS